MRCLGKNLMHSRLVVRGFHPGKCHFYKLIQGFERIHHSPRIYGRPLRIELEYKLGHDAKIASTSPNAKEQIGVLTFARR